MYTHWLVGITKLWFDPLLKELVIDAGLVDCKFLEVSNCVSDETQKKNSVKTKTL